MLNRNTTSSSYNSSSNSYNSSNNNHNIKMGRRSCSTVSVRNSSIPTQSRTGEHSQTGASNTLNQPVV